MVTVRLGRDAIQAELFPEWSQNLETNVAADFVRHTPREMASQIQYLTLDKQVVDLPPFMPFWNGKEIIGQYAIYDERFNRVPTDQPSSATPQTHLFPPQTNLFLDAKPGRYIVVLSFTVETASAKSGYQCFFGAIVPDPAAPTTATTRTLPPQGATTAAKPVIYLYPQQTTDVQVRLDFAGQLTCTYPTYQDGWQVTASPDGTLVNRADGRTYSYLFWEGIDRTEYDFSRGFVVAGKDTAAFLQEKLAFLGLMPREYNEFIVYWLPHMQDNAYNLITFQGERYTSQAKLTIEPKPDSLLRVFMAYKPLVKRVEIEESVLKPFVREGFAVVEWGGARIEN